MWVKCFRDEKIGYCDWVIYNKVKIAWGDFAGLEGLGMKYSVCLALLCVRLGT